MSVIRYCILILRQSLCQYGLLLFIQITLIERTAREHIKQFSFMVIINHLPELIRRDRIRFRTRYESLLLDHIAFYTEVIDPDAHFPFMRTAVHVSVHHKCKIAVIIHTDDPHSMLVIPAAHITAFLIRKTENLRDLSGLSIV